MTTHFLKIFLEGDNKIMRYRHYFKKAMLAITLVPCLASAGILELADTTPGRAVIIDKDANYGASAGSGMMFTMPLPAPFK